MIKIIFATKNKGKIKETNLIMNDLRYEIISMQDVGINIDIIEDGSTFEENALIKARAVAEKTHCIVIADDSGLEVDYLNKEPGIYSARYGGENLSFSEKNKLILSKLIGTKKDNRTARFVCAFAIVFPDKTSCVKRGIVEGIIAEEEIGDKGFGYDPIFYLPEYNRTMAQLTSEEKNKISHRGSALKLIKEIINNYLLYGNN